MPIRTEVETQKLGAEEQRVVAEVELARLRKRDKLLRQARAYQGKRWLTVAFLIPVGWVALKSADYYSVLQRSLLRWSWRWCSFISVV